MMGDDHDNANYISRGGTLGSFVEDGYRKRYCEQSTAHVVEDLLKNGKSVRDIICEHVELRGYVNQNKWVLLQAERNHSKKRTRDDYEGPRELYPWQRHVVDRLELPVDPRHIEWYMDHEGNVGKTELTDLLVTKYEAIEWKPIGKDRDCSYQLLSLSGGHPPKLIVCDVENNEARNICWPAVERAKNGKCMTDKYEGGSYHGQRPRIIFFSNEDCVGCPLTGNRISVFEIRNKEITSERRI